MFELSGSSPGALVAAAVLPVPSKGVATISIVADPPEASSPILQLTVVDAGTYVHVPWSEEAPSNDAVPLSTAVRPTSVAGSGPQLSTS